MGFWLIRDAVLVLALGPFIYAMALWAGILHFRRKKQGPSARSNYTPPISILKPVRGLEFQVKSGLLIPVRAAKISGAERQRRASEVLE